MHNICYKKPEFAGIWLEMHQKAPKTAKKGQKMHFFWKRVHQYCLKYWSEQFLNTFISSGLKNYPDLIPNLAHMVKILIFFLFLLIIWLDCPQSLKMCPKIFLKNVFEFARSFASKRKKSANRKTFQKNWPEKGLFWGQNDVTKSRKLTLHLQLARTSILIEILVWAILKHLHPFRLEKLGRFDTKFA